jgi:hypothetical protein
VSFTPGAQLNPKNAMSGSRMPPQITRLVLLACGIVATYAVARVVLTPKSFGQYGHFRGAALEEIASREPTFAGAKACDECHSEVRDKLAKYEHKGISCESCHGPTRAHVDDPDVATTKLGNPTCMRCHSESPVRPQWLKQVKPDHYGGDKCADCHLPHQPKESP